MKPIKIYNYTKYDYSTLGVIIDDILRKYDKTLKWLFIEIKGNQFTCNIQEYKRSLTLSFYHSNDTVRNII